MILVLNCGSQSVKWKLFDEKLKPAREGFVEVYDEKDYANALLSELEKLSDLKDQINIVGHRIVHGGGKFEGPLELNNENLMELEKFSKLAPLHNPFNILGVRAAQRVFAEARQIGFFDSDFFRDLPEVARTYPLPKDILDRYGFKRLGFHGISHEFIAKAACQKANLQYNKAKIITCHLGGGASMAAIKNGKPIDTSMGFTPMDGLVMDTRSGSIDPGIVLQLAEELSVDKARDILNKNSGLAGVCKSGEMLEVLEKIERGDKSAKLALDIYTYSVKKHIGAYFVALGGCDVLVFTGSIGSGKPKTHSIIVKGLDILKKTKVLAMKTDEELAIAQKIKI